jgi:hypothetical protein
MGVGTDESVVRWAEMVDSGGAVAAAGAFLSLSVASLVRGAETGVLITGGSEFGLGSRSVCAGSSDRDDVSEEVLSSDSDTSASLSESSAASDADEEEELVEDVDDDESDESDTDPDGEFFSDDAESDGGFDDDESDFDEDELESSASATPGHAATAAPTPSATASAPTRPMYFALPVVCAR